MNPIFIQGSQKIVIAALVCLACSRYLAEAMAQESGETLEKLASIQLEL